MTAAGSRSGGSSSGGTRPAGSPSGATRRQPTRTGPSRNRDGRAPQVRQGRAAHRSRRQHQRRLGLLVVGVAAACVLLGARLVFVQVLDGSRYARYTSNETLTKVVLPASRGSIYDRSGNLLAVSVPRVDVLADDFLVTDAVREAAALSPILHVPASTLALELHRRSGYVHLAYQVTQSTAARLAALYLPGISFQSNPLRSSPPGALFQPVLGGVNASGSGYAGLEYLDQGVLNGVPGHAIEAVAPGGVALPGSAKNVVAPHDGAGLVLSLDEPLQVEVTRDVTEQMLATHAASGIAVVMDVHTGAVLALVDLVRGPHNTIVPASSNLALTAIYQPGSVMKLATISFALQAGIITPNTVFTVPYSIAVGGYTFADADPHPTLRMTVSQILAQSSNVGTIEIAKLLGPARLAQALAAFGFGKFSGMNWPGESPGIVGNPTTWYGSAAASVPIGTGVAVTPMQILDAYNAVANGGRFVAPRLLAATVPSASPQVPLAPSPSRKVLDPATVRALVPMLEGVVQDGTAVAACIPNYAVAGKTGTAQVPSTTGRGYVAGDWNATFVGFVPAQAPQLSGIVILNHPTPIYGGTVSAPVFAKIMSYALRRFDLAPPAGSPTGPSGACSATPAAGGTGVATTVSPGVATGVTTTTTATVSTTTSPTTTTTGSTTTSTRTTSPGHVGAGATTFAKVAPTTSVPGR